MPIPRTRLELTDSVHSTYEKLRIELDAAGARVGNLPCVDDWSIKDLLAVRVWWTEQVVSWIEAGKRGECPMTPAPGYRWHETPRLNAEIVKKHKRQSYRSVRNQLQAGYENVSAMIELLDDRELFNVGVFEWAGRYPVARWISINTARQYQTARTFVRRALPT